MDTYLLLRSNKQSGPYTLPQLVNVGLKPYDLVWVEGKSAAWRYPSEVDLLKDYAPATEEQPFDRFYKKQEQKKQEQPVTQSPEPKEEVFVQPVANKTSSTSRKVFVSMPEHGSLRQAVQPAPAKTPTIIEEKPKTIEEQKIKRTPVHITGETREPVLKEKPAAPVMESLVKTPSDLIKEDAALNEKYSESLDDIKKRYAERYLDRKKQSRWTSTHTSILQVVGGAVFFCLLVVVAYKNFAGEEKPEQRTTIIQPDRRAINTSTVSTLPASNVPSTPGANKQSSKKTAESKETLRLPDQIVVRNDKTQQKTEAIINEDENEIASIEDKPVEKKAVMPTPGGESKSDEGKPKTRTVNINRLVKVKANNYKQRAFGGVMNLELTVDNDSKFELERVVVELQYLKPSEQPIKTERIVFHSVGPNESKTLKIPDFMRGVKIAYRVADIESSQYERQTAGL